MRRDDSPEEGRPFNEGASRSGGSDTPFIVIFTDLDGTLLDHHTYDWAAAGPALGHCKRLGVPVVMVSSKTRTEMEGLRQALGLSSPYISENGGGIFFPLEGPHAPPREALRKGRLWKWSLGMPYDALVRALAEIKEEVGWPIRGFSEMTPSEISELTGLDFKAAALAAKREFDEPFILEEGGGRDMAPLKEAARSRGLRISSGGRFHHLHGRSDKAGAVGKLLSWYRKDHPYTVSVALGDSPNDFTMLGVVDHPVLVRSLRQFPGVEEEIPGLRITSEAGPRGWNGAVLEILTLYYG